MPIIHYAAQGTIVVGLLLLVAGIACVLVWTSLRADRPKDEEDERRRERLAGTGMALTVIGILLSGVGVLFL